MGDVRLLLEHRARILATVRRARSLPHQVREELADFIDRALEAAAARADRAPALSRTRSAVIGAAIVAAASALPTSQPLRDRVRVVTKRLAARPQLYGLRKGPHARTIRRVLCAQPEIDGTFNVEDAADSAQTSG